MSDSHTRREAKESREANKPMSKSNANQHVPSPEVRSLSIKSEAHVASAEELALISLSARLLFENGQSTEKIVSALDQLADTMGLRATVFPAGAT